MNATNTALALAKEKNIDLTNIDGTGANGRIVKNDVVQYEKFRNQVVDLTVSMLQGDLQSPEYVEAGVVGLDYFSGYIQEAYLTELTWPTVATYYDKLRRADPEVAMVRNAFYTLGGEIEFKFVMPADDPTDDDLLALDYANSVLEEMEGGPGVLRETVLENVPFFGWGWWEIVPGIRNKDWRPPDRLDTWRSRSNDGLVGIRRLGWRSPKSFSNWEFDPGGRGIITAMVQWTMQKNTTTIPKSRSIHVTFGDPHNPEGLSPLEAVHRLERIKYALEFIFGRGMERSAGFAKFTAKGKLTDADINIIKNAARAILSAQENNYLALPSGIEAALIDSAFQSAAALLEAIKYYGITKLQLYNMQWIALSATTGSGSYSAMDDSSSMFVQYFNNMVQGFAAQIDQQLGEWLFRQPDVAGAFPNMTARPKFVATKINKTIALDMLGSFIDSFANVGDLGPDDIKAIRKASRFLPEELPEEGEILRRPPGQDAAGQFDLVDRSGNFTQYAHDLAAGHVAFFSQIPNNPQAATLRAIEGNYPAQRHDYFNTILDIVSEYLGTPGGRSTTYKNRMKQAVADNFVAAFATGYLTASGGDSIDEIDAEARAWLGSKQQSEFTNVDFMFDTLLTIKQTIQNNEEGAPTVLDVATARADGYTYTLDGVFNQARLYGDQSKLLWFVGEDGADSCTTCQKWKNKKHTAKFWLDRGLVPYPGNFNFECGAWRCHHFHVDRDGNQYTFVR